MTTKKEDTVFRPITMTVYLYAKHGDGPHEWNISEWLDDPNVVAWDIEEGHGECNACATDCANYVRQ